MIMEEKNNSMVCPNCGRHCPIDEVRCPRGEEFAAEMRGEYVPMERDEGEREHGPHDEREHGPHGERQRGPHGERGHGPHGERGHGPHGECGHGPHGDREHGPHGEREHGPCGEHGPHGDREHGPHGHGPMPFEDDDSLTALMLRCAHSLRHPDGRGGSQGRVLRILSRWDGLSQRALQERLGVQPGSLSELVSKLEAKGLLTREQDGEDKRRVLLRLTEAGRAATEEAPSPQEKDARFALLTEEEQASLRSLLTKLLSGVTEDAR